MKLTFTRARALARKNKHALAIAATTVAGSAMAAGEGPDAATIVAYMVAAGVTIALVGNAKLVMELGVKAFKWIRGAMS